MEQLQAADKLSGMQGDDFRLWLHNQVRGRHVRSYPIPAERIQRIFKEKEQIFRRSLPSPFVLIVTDQSGAVLFSMGQPDCRQSYLSRIAREGVNLVKDPHRIRPLEMAVERKNDVFLTGEEPWLGEEMGWACLALALNNPASEVFGFFALFTPPQHLSLKAYPYVKSISMIMESEINSNRPTWVDFTDYMGHQLEQFDLTPRERQVAALWMMDYDYKQIGRAIGISENTVRVITNRLNAKMNVNSKASLILRVLGAI